MKRNTIFFLIFQIILLTAMCFAQERNYNKNLIDKGIAHYKSGEYEKAIESFSEVIKKSLDKNELLKAYTYLGYTYYTLGEMKNAEVQVKKGIELKPEYDLNEQEFVSEFIEFFKGIKKKTIGVGFFESMPSKAFIYINNQKVGLTPLKKELLIGKYELKAVKWGYSSILTEVEIKSNEVAYKKFDFIKTKNWKTFIKSSLIMVAFTLLMKSI